jgi:competence ComEA-like helix-hairpin-helix protein
MKEVLLLLSILISAFLISAQCNETQIDINSASLEELDNITTVGAVIAQNIINSRPFNSVEDLIKVNRIGNATLEKIKAQGLACVSENNISINNATSEINETANNAIISPSIKEQTSPEVIVLNPLSKDIKSNDNVLSSERIALYGFIAFSVLLGFLFAAKKIRSHKTEFQER